MWLWLLVLILVGCAAVMYYRGPVAALGTGVLVTFLFPSWIVQPIAGVPIDLRIATTLILLLANVADPRRRIVWNFMGADWAVFVLYFVQVASDCWNDGFMLAHFVRAFGEWSIPYIAGRLSIQNVQDWRWLTQVAVIVAAITGTLATAETITHVNLESLVFGSRPADQADFVMLRNGFKRAEGPTRHPIWFGMLQTLLLPWTIEAARRGMLGDGPIWWPATPFICLCGIMATVSRGPALAGLGVLYLVSLFTMVKFRKPLIAVGIVLAILGIIGRSYLRQSLEDIDVVNSGNFGVGRAQKDVEFDGEKQRLTSVSHRWLIFSAYREAIRETGLLGYGTANTSSFPVNVPFGPEARQTVSKFWSIDCEYLLILLRFGWLGLAAFAAVCVMSVRHLANQSELVLPRENLLPWAITATLVSTSLALIIEWMPHDYGFLFLWSCGVANGPRLTKKAELPKTSSRRHRSSKYEYSKLESAKRESRKSESESVNTDNQN